MNDMGNEVVASDLPVVVLAGVSVRAISETQCVSAVMEALDRGQGGWLVTPNVDHLRRARYDSDYQRLLGRADLAVPDGVPLIWASWLQGTPLPERVAGSSLVESLAAAAAEHGRTIFLLGGAPGSAEQASRTLRSRYTGLQISGTSCPPMGFEADDLEVQKIRSALDQARPDLVYVALGSPKQERLIELLHADLPQTWWMGVGISLSFISGDIKRAPRWVQYSGFEWLHRLIQEPRRLAKRYLVHDVPFAFRLFAGAAWRRIHRSNGKF